MCGTSVSRHDVQGRERIAGAFSQHTTSQLSSWGAVKNKAQQNKAAFRCLATSTIDSLNVRYKRANTNLPRGFPVLRLARNIKKLTCGKSKGLLD